MNMEILGPHDTREDPLLIRNKQVKAKRQELAGPKQKMEELSV